MARINKKSRIKGLPPRLLLQARDSHSGSFPTKFRTASDGNNGSYDIFFDDTSIVNFVNGTINLGSGIQNDLSTSARYVDFGQDMSSSITTNTLGAIRKGIADSFIAYNNPNADSVKPFKEHLHIDSKTRFNDSFHATGSNINDMAGQDFTSPLWSKTKIIIDLTPKVEHSIAIRNFTSGTRNHPMCYWNNDLKVWEGIGTGKEFSHADYFYADGNTPNSVVKTAYEKFFYEQTIGFAGGILSTLGAGESTDTNDIEFPKNSGSPVDNFLFPVNNKYHGTGSNLIKMSNYIDTPFILEKIVLEISCAYNANRAYGYWNQFEPLQSFRNGRTPTIQVCNFFILNQTTGKKQTVKRKTTVYSGSMAIEFVLSSSTSQQYNNSTRELVTWADVCHAPTPTITDYMSDYVVQGEYALLDKQSVTANRYGDYYSKNSDNFSTLTLGGKESGTWLAAGVIGSSGREFKFGNSGSSARAIPALEYSASHPEFDSIVGADGTLSGQEAGYYYNIDVASWNKNLQISMSCKSPIKKQNISLISIWDYVYQPTTNDFASRITSHGSFAGIENNGRSFNNKTIGRDFKNSIRNANENEKSAYKLDSLVGFSWTSFDDPLGYATIYKSLESYKQQNIPNPYLLLPSDNLIFGWQLPVADVFATAIANGGDNYNFAHTLGPQLTFAPTPAKITLYGSYAKEGKEQHDTLNQYLTSNTIHEIIG